MARKGTGSAKRYGSRYGRRLRERVQKVEQEQRKLHVCPYCKYEKVKRLAIGIWQCKNCSIKFTSKAYTVAKAPVIKIQEEAE